MGSIYDVTISAAGLGGAAPADGFIDPKTASAYIAASDAPTTAAVGRAKARANRRYKTLIMKLDYLTNAYVLAVTTVGAGGDTAPSSITIRLEIEHGTDALVTFDTEASDPADRKNRITGIAALKRAVARALVVEEARNIEFYDPTVVVGRDIDGSDNAGKARGSVINMETIGALTNNLTTAESKITVTFIEETNRNSH